MPIIKDGDAFGTTTTIKDSNGNKVSVPGGFKITSDSGNNVSEGVVIEDSKGNQFVWIPVNSEADFQQNLSYPKLYPYEITKMWDPNDAYPEGIYDINKLIQIGGFYVSRFWVMEENGSYVSKKGNNLEDWRLHKKRSQLISGLRNNCINTRYAKTSLISGVAYDSMMRFLHGKWTGKTYFDENVVRAEDGFVTGGSSAGAICNIFDIASMGYGCLTAEKADTTYVKGLQVFRGRSGYQNNAELKCPSHRGFSATGVELGTPCARAALYVFD